MIRPNEQYYLQVKVSQNGTPITTSDCAEMIIKVGNVVKKKSLNQLSFDLISKNWLYPLSFEQTSNLDNLSSKMPVQAWFKVSETTNDEYFATNVVTLEIGENIILKSDIGELV